MILQMRKERLSADIDQVAFKKSKDRCDDVLDLGTNKTESVDYPDFAYALSSALIEGRASRGVLICGSGIGISIAANRFSQIRAALVHDALGAKLCREHNNANVIATKNRRRIRNKAV